QFDAESIWHGTFTAVDFNGTVALMNIFSKPKFLQDIAVKQSLSTLPMPPTSPGAKSRSSAAGRSYSPRNGFRMRPGRGGAKRPSGSRTLLKLSLARTGGFGQ